MHIDMHRTIVATPTAVVFAICLLAAGNVHAQVPTELHGDWVPAAGACTAAVRLRVDAARLTLINGADTESLGGIEMAGPAYFGPGYNGIMAVAITEFSGDQPATATFNVGEKKGVAQIEFEMPGPGRAPNAAVAALNAHFTKLNLAKRFPIHAVPLRKCGVSVRR